MATIQFKETPIAEAFAAIERNQENPALMVDAYMDLVESVSDGEVAYVDATNPSVLTMEMMSVGISTALRAVTTSLRKAYPKLANTADDVKDHMSDWDYVNMFASPSTEPFYFFMSYEGFVKTAVRDDTEGCVKIVIPRDTFVTLNGRTFTLNYPIVIRRYDTGNLEVSYDATIQSNFQTLATNIITTDIIYRPSGETYMLFTVDLMQFEISRETMTTSRGQVFDVRLPYNDKFYYARAWYRNTSTGNKWKEMLTTHGRMNYNPETPTMLLTKEEDNVLRCQLPQIYMLNDALLGEIAIDIYTTLGNMNEQMPDETYAINFRNLDASENSQFTPQALSEITRWATPQGALTGGKDDLTTEQLLTRVIYNSTGPQEIPISPTQIQARLENNGFTVDRTVDMVTDRIFYANRKLPAPTDKKLITSANIGIHTFITEKEALRDHSLVYVNDNRWTVSPKNLYEFNNGVIRMLSMAEINQLNQLDLSTKVQTLNQRQFLFTPFHYVYDMDNLEFDLRAYYLNKPTAGLINFFRINPTLQLSVNTGDRAIVRTENGYQLQIVMKSGANFKQIPDSQVGVQLRFNPQGDKTNVYLRGYQIGMRNEERVFAFDLNTDYDINGNNALHILGVGVNGTENQSAWIDLETTFDIFVCTSSLTSIYVDDDSVKAFGAWQFEEGFKPITHEKVTLTLGKTLKSLWRRARNAMTYQEYQLYQTTIQATYEEDEYKINPVNGTIWFINEQTGLPEKFLEHAKGDLKFDPNTGEPIYKHVAGTPIYENGQPLLKDAVLHPKESDMLFIDGRHAFVTDKAYLAYNQELVDILVDWVTEDLEDIQKRTLEKTYVYFHPRSQIGSVKINYGDGKVKTIPSEQSPRLDLYLPDTIIDDENMRDTVKRLSIQILDKALTGTELNHSDITESLRKAYGSSVKGFRLYGFGPDRDIYYANLLDVDRTLALKRIIEAQTDGTLIMREDVTFNFYSAEKKTME